MIGDKQNPPIVNYIYEWKWQNWIGMKVRVHTIHNLIPVKNGFLYSFKRWTTIDRFVYLLIFSDIKTKDYQSNPIQIDLCTK